MSDAGWIGVDLDGTLAHYDEWRGVDHVGAPIPEMVERVKAWRRDDIEVRVFTARVAVGQRDAALPAIEAWLLEHVGEVLPVTHEKDFGMVALWDDRCVQVITNTGVRADGRE